MTSAKYGWRLWSRNQSVYATFVYNTFFATIFEDGNRNVWRKKLDKIHFSMLIQFVQRNPNYEVEFGNTGNSSPGVNALPRTFGNRADE